MHLHFGGLPDLVVLLIFVIPFAGMAFAYATQRLKTKERLAAIEKGVPVPLEPSHPKTSPEAFRRKGIVMIALGLGIFAFALVGRAVEGDPDMLIAGALGFIPLFLGIGLLADYWLSTRT
jgi:hypothetical protein